MAWNFMSIIEAIIIGIIQGATEFLPISSSGHLVLLPEIFQMTRPDLTLIGLVHTGTLLAVIIYFRQDLWGIITAVLRDLSQHQPLASNEARLGWLLVVGSIPVALIGLPFNMISVLTGSLIFRILDIWKPYPIRWFERKLSGGVGIVMDDIVAGILGNIILRVSFSAFKVF